MTKDFHIRNFEEMKPDLIRFGFAFYGDRSKKSPDPEKLIIEVAAGFDRDLKTFKMLLSVLYEIYDLIHVERLKNMVPLLGEYNQIAKLGLFIIASRLKERDHRFNSLVELLKQKVRPESPEFIELFKALSSPFSIEKYGQDLDLKSVGITAYKLDQTDKKKTLSREQILGLNLWLRIRVLVGTNFRADCLYLMTLGEFKTRYQFWKAMVSSQENAYRICNELSAVKSIVKFEFREST